MTRDINIIKPPLRNKKQMPKMLNDICEPLRTFCSISVNERLQTMFWGFAHLISADTVERIIVIGKFRRHHILLDARFIWAFNSINEGGL